MTDRRTGGLGANVDFSVDPSREVGSLGLSVDMIVDPDRRVGALGLMVDYVYVQPAAMPTTAVIWW